MTRPARYLDPSRADLVAVDVLELVLDWALASILAANCDLTLECDAGRAGPDVYLAESLTHQIAHLQRTLAAYRVACRDAPPEDEHPF